MNNEQKFMLFTCTEAAQNDTAITLVSFFFISIYCAFLSRLISIEKSRSELLDFVVPIINVILHAPCMEPLSSLSRRVMGHRIRWWIRPQECRKLLWENFVLDAAMALDVFILGVLMSIFSDGFEFCGRLQLHVFLAKMVLVSCWFLWIIWCWSFDGYLIYWTMLESTWFFFLNWKQRFGAASMHQRSETMLHLGIFSFGHFVLWSLLHRCSDIDGIRFLVVIKIYNMKDQNAYFFCKSWVVTYKPTPCVFFTDLCIGM